METEQLIKEGIANAPKEVQEYLANSGWNTITDDIATQNNLSLEQKVELENEVLFVLIGFDIKTNLTKNIIENVGLPSLTAGGIALEIEQKVFTPINQFLPTSIETEATPDRLTSSPTQIQPPTTEVPLPIKPQTTLEEKIAPLIGTPGEKIDWEERKLALEKSKIITDSYSGKDPYREPIQ